MLKLKTLIWIITFGLVFSFSGFSQTNQEQNNSNNEKLAFSIYGQDHMIALPLPNYWTVDMDVAHQNNLNGFFYIKGNGIDASPVYIFFNLYEKKEGAEFQDFILYMVEDLRNYQPDYEVEIVNAEKYSTTMNNWNVEIYDVKKKVGKGHYQKIAYMECENK